MTTKRDLWQSPLWWTLDDNGVPRACRSLEDMLARQLPKNDPRVNVGENTVTGSQATVYVSTKFFNMNMGIRSGKPVLWETMVFLVDPTPKFNDLGLPPIETTWSNELVQLRHTSLEQARKTHQDMLAMARLLVESPQANDYDWARTYVQGYVYGSERDDGTTTK